MQDEYGRTLSDDGQWVWDGSEWRPAGSLDPEPGEVTEPTPFYQNPIVIIGALLVLAAVLVTILVLSSGSGKGGTAGPTPSVGPSVTVSTAAPTTAPPTTPPPTTRPPAPPTTQPPTTQPPTSAPPTVPVSTTVAPGSYDCTSGGSLIGTAKFVGSNYTTSSGAAGTYQYSSATHAIHFTGGDLGDYSGTYDPSGPSMDLTSANGGQLHCAQ